MDLQGLHRLCAFKRRIRVPLAHVRGAIPAPDIVHEPKGRRAPGLHVPGVAVIGTFHRDGERHFWDVRDGTHAIVVELTNETYDRLVVDVKDPVPPSTPSTARCPADAAERRDTLRSLAASSSAAQAVPTETAFTRFVKQCALPKHAKAAYGSSDVNRHIAQWL